ncbi:MAG TPA: cytochrome c oxidase subunit 3 family protein [Vicinamibacterales bacterium]|nr:cytochrome c oxidase subunit 3 family protein [Vicinamibacterales bacterium]
MSNAVAHAEHDHAHEHHPALQHHFDTMAQQKEAAVIGMWVFLLTEILFFGGLFVAYMIYRVWYFDAFAEASRRLSLFWGGLNTAVLIGSSLTMALAVRAAQTSNRRWTVNWLVLTMLLGCVFLGVKVIEYQDKFANYEVPGDNYNWLYHEQHLADGAAAPAHRELRLTPEQLQNTTQIYFSLYFTMTGLHALHMIIGVGLMAVITWMAWKGKFDAAWYTPVEMSGLYWHFVDIVWIFLFPLLYLVERP